MIETPETNYDAEVDKLYAEIARLSLPQNIKKNAIKKHAKVALNIMYGMIVCVLLFVLVVVQIAKEDMNVPSVFGYTLFYVQTGSMEPTYNIGSIVLAKSVKDTAHLSAGKDGVKDGDVIAFYDTTGRKITHRIESVVILENGETAYKTRGDNVLNSTDSEVLTQDRIIAKVIMRVF